MAAETVAIALVHHPVVNKIGEVIGSAVTNLDLHDIARVARTYGVGKYYITTPYEDQQKLVGEILDHWQTGHGSTYNPARKEALSIVDIHESLENVIKELEKKHGSRPLLVATTAKVSEKTISYTKLQEKIVDKQPILLLFGTAHGLSPEIMNTVDSVLPPIEGGTNYNHLPVRAAAAIIIDRLLGQKR